MYLGVTLTSDGWDIEDIQNKIRQGNVIKNLHPARCNDLLMVTTKKRNIGGQEVWTMTKKRTSKFHRNDVLGKILYENNNTKVPNITRKMKNVKNPY